MWNCEGGKKQIAYRIVATSDGKTVWDSGKVLSSSMRAEYPKAPLSRQRVEWTVTLWDENDKEGESATAFFEYGLLSPADWKAKWISGNYRVNKKLRYPVDCFKKDFTAIGVRKARLYVTACGLYEVKINGKKAGEQIFAPGSTDYRRRIQYQTYDVRGALGYSARMEEDKTFPRSHTVLPSDVATMRYAICYFPPAQFHLRHADKTAYSA